MANQGLPPSKGKLPDDPEKTITGVSALAVKEKLDGSQADSEYSLPVLDGDYRQKWYQFWLPVDPPRAPYPSIDDAPEIPIATASFWSLLTFSWITEIMIIGWQRPLQIGDLWRMNDGRKSAFLAQKLEVAWTRRQKAADEWNALLASGQIHPSSLRKLWWKVKARGNNTRMASLEAAWAERSRRAPSIVWALSEVFGVDFWLGGLFKLVGDAAQMCGPLVSKTIIRFAQERAAAKANGTKPPNVGRGVGAAIGLFCLTVLTSCCQHQWFWRSMSSGILARASLINLLFSRGLSLTPKSRTKHSNGALVNHLSTDVSRIDFLFQWAHPVWTAPVQVLICLTILCVQLGPSALAGFSLFVLLMPLQERAMTMQLRMRRASMKYTDKRANLLQEILGAMRITKLFTYELPFWERIAVLRREELKGIRVLLLARAATQAVAFSIPVLASVLAFVVYALAGHDLNPAIIFTSLSLFNLLRQPLMFLPRSLSAVADGLNAFSRLSQVLQAETLDHEILIDEDAEYAVQVKNASFEWESAPAPTKTGGSKKGTQPAPSKASAKPSESAPSAEPFAIRNLSLSIPRGGSVYAIVGPIGGGKSSLLNGLIGEMRKTEGEVRFGGRLAFCAQLPWIQNATLRENVIFGRPFEKERYWQVIEDACLMTDLQLLPDGDLTEIGEKGINLSGGQKARVNLARALYSDADIIAMDDPLSAVDAHVAERLFSRVILGLKARGKTVILVTHALHFLHQVDYVYHISDGRIQEEGTFESLVALNGGFAALVQEFASFRGGDNAKEENKEPSSSVTEVHASADNSKQSGAAEGTGKEEGILIKKEVRKTGSISSAVYRSYMRAGGGMAMLLLTVSSAVLMQAATVLTSYWLVWWEGETFHKPSGFYMGIYAGLGTTQAIFTFVLGATMSLISFFASAKMHGNALTTILRAPMSFFDTTPIGRILGVLGKDMDTIDNVLADSLRMAAMTLSSLLGSIILISILFPYFLPIVAFVLIGYYGLARFYSVSSREMKRLDGILRSALYSHFAESLSGIATIRAYGATSRFVHDNSVFIDHEDSALYLTITNQRWLSIRLDVMGGILVFVVALMAVFGLNGVSAAQVGLTLTYIVSVTQILGMVTRQTTEVENNMNAVERVFQYSDEGSIAQEAAYDETSTTSRVPPTWPERGDIEFDNVFVSYREGLPSVLQGISLHIRGGEKIGIVGRTGAGKSSMMAVLFRLIEISSGKVSIDGANISQLALKTLRSRLSIIPQDPMIFSGTIRSNLDPFSQLEDAVLWDAMRRAHITSLHSGEAVSASTNRFTLDTAVEADGANLSVGERSLLSLARALCKDSQVVVMDEATASVDLETDAKIQETILREFAHKTVLCVAHRLRTIINYDRILVLDRGRVAEFDTPLSLFDQENGIFRSMCEKSHIERGDIEAALRKGWN
ncbi:ABC protein [Clavulina sp. PMI_390]|nr:ABC protein [Clavulina sp. PMI_390]